MDGHAYRVGRNIFEGGKPTFSDLLIATRLVKKHHVVSFGRFEIGRRVIEGQVGVLADTDQSDIDRRLQQAPGSVLADRFGVGCSIEEMKGFQWDFIDEAGFQVAAERCAMIRRDADIFVQVEPFDAGPIDARFGRQGIEDFELARSGRDDDSSLATLGDGAAKDHGGEFRRIGTHSGSVGLDDDIDDYTSWQERCLRLNRAVFPMKTIVAQPEVVFCLPDF